MDSPISPKQAHARAIVCAMTALVDLQHWSQLTDCFDEQVRVDYSSLWGGEAQQLARADLIGQWRAMLPGFDATAHQLGPVEVQVDGDKAAASADVQGTHVLGDQAWVVEGRYRIDLVRRGRSWRITALTLDLTAESGDRDLTERAKQRSA